MSLTTSLGSLVRGLGVTQTQISVASNNISNVNTPGYAKQTANQATLIADGVGQGSFISSFSSEIDEALIGEMQTTSSSLSKSTVLDNYYESILRLYGAPGANDGLSAALDDFFVSSQNLSDNPDVASARLIFANSAQDLANKISDVASELNELRFEADQEIASNVTAVNTILTRLEISNDVVAGFPEGSQGRATLDGERNNDIRELSEFLNVTSFVDSSGRLFITGGNISLLDTSRQNLSYIPATSASTFVQDGALNSVQATPVDNEGQPTGGTSVDLISGGLRSEITTDISDGSLSALVNLRDTEIPNLLEQLDVLAVALRDEVNAIHNDGTSFPPPTTLTGGRTVTGNTEVGFTGTVRIAALNQDGTPITSPYSNETAVKPFDLDLGSLSSSVGDGRPTVQTIIDEINYYYGPVQNRAQVGVLQDVKLVAVSDSITDGGTVQFDLEVDNISTSDATVVIQAVTVIDPIDSSTAYNAATLPSTNSFTSTAGVKSRTDQPFTVDFGGDDNRTSYTVRVRVQVTDADGNVSEADIDYTVEDNVTSVINDRYPPQAVSNVSGTSALELAPSSESYVTARLVDANGIEISDPNTEGFLELRTTSSVYGIAIDELTSQETGVSGALTSDITNFGFSHYFELNNLFVGNNDVVTNSAFNLAVRDDITVNANNISVGGLTLSNQPDDTNSALYTYELGSGNNEIALRMASISDNVLTFSATTTLPETNTSLTSYVGDVTGFVAVQKTNTESLVEIFTVSFDGLKQAFQEFSGVNTDEELANIIELETQFRAMSQALSVARDLLQILSQLLD